MLISLISFFPDNSSDEIRAINYRPPVILATLLLILFV
jgi:hypothetical protein